MLVFSTRAIAPYLRNLEAQKQFITNAGHELKTPLTAILTSADLLAMEHGDDEWVRGIQLQARRLSKLITSLVTLSRLDEENPFPEKAEFSLSDAVWEAAEPFRSLARAAGKSYTQQIEDDLLLTGDRTAVCQTVSILLDNAVKYCDEGGSIRLRLFRSGRRSVLEVANSCAHAQDMDVSRLFDRFYRPDESHARATGGTGIGLSIARATAQAHGGTIDARALPGEIVFQLRL